MKPEDFRRSIIHEPGEFLAILERRLKSAGSSGRVSARARLLEKLSTCYQLVDGELSKAEAFLRKVIEIGGFHAELFKLEASVEPGEVLKRIKALRRAAVDIYASSRSGLKASEGEVAAREVFRAGVGRLVSIYKRNRRILSTVRKTAIEFSRMPDVEGDLRVIIAGMPQAGKSTLISRLTNAKPEIGFYPFTTKNIIAGHLAVEPYGRIVLIDTPGILDRPMSERNPVEHRAVLAVKHLADALLFLIDPSPGKYYSLDEQLNVYRTVQGMLQGKPLMIVLNKADATPPGELEEARERVRRETGAEPLVVSALTGLNLDALKNWLVGLLKAGTQGF
ncbi:50S ribosome-binding GTPase [Thermosphaera chiliense]|uniref:50S ribosome-binding GTPase n=1 Tax=Thermosphaera chiliense TaxID=3402707 RepID=A0A7M1URB9_9CREN|nr:GTPase [Thermosphaera aggregans]QOR94596.1 50S ribosome-binding GTPase [Thermosphaera aggregans]